MTRRTHADFALWAALPMAHTSKVEGRIKMVLDTTRRRTLPRRAITFGIALTAAALVPLAMLRPDAKAQAMSPSAQTAAASGPVQLIGITDGALPDGRWWNATGGQLSASPFNIHWEPLTDVSTTVAGQKHLFFVFHLSKSLRHVPMLYDVSGTTQGGITLTRWGGAAGKKTRIVTETMQSIQMQSADGTVVYGAAFPALLPQTSIRVGAASGLWATALTVHYNFKRGFPAVSISGSQYAGAIDVSGDTLKYSLPTKTPTDFYDIRFIAVDNKGHSTLLPTTKTESKKGREQSTVRQPRRLSLIREIRIEARPLVWTEFKDVTLKPVQ